MADLALSTSHAERAARARSVHEARAAERAVDDPVKLARAVRIVRAAFARNALRPAEVLPQGCWATDDAQAEAAG